MKTPEPHASSDDVTTYKVRFRLNGKQSSETFDTKREAEQAATVPMLDQVAADHIGHLATVTDGTRLDYSALWVFALNAAWLELALTESTCSPGPKTCCWTAT